MSNEELDARLVGLRATLSRSGIDLDDTPLVESCNTTHLGERCVRCKVARRDNTAGIEPSLIDSAAIAFSMYPPKLLQATHVFHVALCVSIEVDDRQMAPAGMALLDQKRILVDVGGLASAAEGFTIDRVIHHELFHMLDHAGAYYHYDAQWAALNPPGFTYHDPDKNYLDRELSSVRPPGFVRDYATQNEAEDRASTFELVFGRPDEVCAIAAADPVVAKKVALIKKRVKSIAGPMPQLAPCKKPPPPPPPKRRGPIDLRVRS
jgi:hypothetical protein